jgi:quercetin dioxygenase-like cupin family protein
MSVLENAEHRSARGPDSYFGSPNDGGEATLPGRFVTIAELPELNVARGLVLQPLLGSDLMVSFARYEPGAEAPLHAHEEEQVFVVVDGEFDVTLGDETRRLKAGDAAVIPSWVPHRVTATDDGPATQIDVFSPPREGLVRLLERRPSEA